MPTDTFDDTILPHLDAAFNYARWLTRNAAEAEALVQDSCVRAMRFFASRRHDNARARLFAIVRTTWLRRISRHASAAGAIALDVAHVERRDDRPDSDEQLLRRHAVARVTTAIEQLSADLREVLVLRDIEGMSYKEIAAVLRVPLGTVMRRLARGRERLAALRLATDVEALR